MDSLGFQHASSFNSLPGGSKLCLTHSTTHTLIKIRSLLIPSSSYILIKVRALAIIFWVSKLRRASTSVETRPGTISRIALPKRTLSLSMRTSISSFLSSPACSYSLEQYTLLITLAYFMAASTMWEYSGLVAAARLQSHHSKKEST